MFQLSRFEREAPVLRGQLLSSQPFLKSPVLRDTDSNVRDLQIFQVDQTFYKLDVKILAANNEIRYVHCSCPPSSSSALDPCQQKHLLFWH